MAEVPRRRMHARVAIVGATGAVGQELLQVLQERSFPADRLSCWASARSAGNMMRYGGTQLAVGELLPAAFDGVDVALFSAGAEVSQRLAPAAVERGAVVVDNSSAFRMHPDVPLVIPEVNPRDAAAHKGIVANPNCSTIILLVVLWPLHRVNPIRRVVVSTYQAASGAGRRAMLELQAQARDAAAGRPLVPEVLPHQIAFNVFSHDSTIDETGYNAEERKMLQETRKIFHDERIALTATCVRVPVLRAHSEAVNITFDRPMSPDEARAVLASAPGVRVVDDRRANRFPMPIEATGTDEVLVGRLRQDLSQPDGRGLDLFLCGDQLRKGAALNAIQIADLLLGKMCGADAAAGADPGIPGKTGAPHPRGWTALR